MAAPVRYWNKCCRRCPRSSCSGAANTGLQSAQLPENPARRRGKSDLREACGADWHHPPLPAGPALSTALLCSAAIPAQPSCLPGLEGCSAAVLQLTKRAAPACSRALWEESWCLGCQGLHAATWSCPNPPEGPQHWGTEHADLQQGGEENHSKGECSP